MASEFLSPIPVVSCAIINNDRVLLLRRAIEPGVGQWAFPAGYVEPNESIEHAITREIREETALDVKVTYVRSSGRQLEDGRAFLSCSFIAHTAVEDVVIDEESQDWRWIPIKRSSIEDYEWAFVTHRDLALDLADKSIRYAGI